MIFFLWLIAKILAVFMNCLLLCSFGEKTKGNGNSLCCYGYLCGLVSVVYYLYCDFHLITNVFWE